MLAVTDTGTGMDAITQARMFEPFFTTKGPRGTGLGLSTFYGIVKQSGGNVWVYSEPSRGTTVKVYCRGLADSRPRRRRIRHSVVGSERILLVEDDAAIRRLCATVLRRHGYTVDEAPDGESAMEFALQTGSQIHLLITDVVLPGANGRVVAEQIRQTHSEMKVLYISGYTENAIVHTGVLDPTVSVLAKPFTPATLLERTRAVLDVQSDGRP